MATKTLGNVPQRVDLEVYQGDDLFVRVTLTDTDGAPVDLTGASAAAQIRATVEDPAILAEFDGFIEANVIHLHLSSSVTTGLTVDGVWDLEITDSQGYVATFARGCVAVVAEVTRP